jgi:ABC-type ATPase with predicted acetyltransferase domain
MYKENTMAIGDGIYIRGQSVNTWSMVTGTASMIEPSGTAYIDPYRYPVLESKEIEDLWKCQACGRVYKLSEHLHCESCGTVVTEKSRFVLE